MIIQTLLMIIQILLMIIQILSIIIQILLMIVFRRNRWTMKSMVRLPAKKTFDDYTNTVDDYDDKEEGNNDNNGQVTCKQCQLGDEDDSD